MPQAEMARTVAKAAWTCRGSEAVASDLLRALRLARSGRRGPISLNLPSDALEGSSVDYTESVAGSGFVVSNPNSWSTCGCGQSFSPKGEEAPDQQEGHHAHAHTH